MQNSDKSEDRDRVVSRMEKTVARSFRVVLDGAPVGENVKRSDDLRGVLDGLEYFIPEVLREIHPEWNDESLDGVLPLVVRKTGRYEVEILGQCILISDQSLVPLYLSLQIHATEDRVNRLECYLGEKGPDGMIGHPYGASDSGLKRLYSLKEKIGSIEWAYMVRYGK